MKYHLTVLIIAVRVVIGATLLTALVNLIMGALLIFSTNTESLQRYFKHVFTPSVSNHISDEPMLMGIVLFLFAALLVYGAVGATRIFYCLLNIKNGGFFYEDQANEFKRAGANIVIFAKLNYLLFCAANIFLYLDFMVFLSEIPTFITFYLIGKSLLVINYVIQRGETIKHENDLTI